MNPDTQIRQLLERIDELEKKLKDIVEIKEKFHLLKESYDKHEHSGDDGTKIITQHLRLTKDKTIKMGDSEIAQRIDLIDTSGEVDQLNISVGRDPRFGYATNSKNAQVNVVFQPNDTISYFNGIRPPLYTSPVAGNISVTSGGTTVTIRDYPFTTNELAGALINIYNSSGTFIESREIASNTATVVTITETWGATTTSGSYFIYFPMYLGISSYIWKRLYTGDGTGGGIRFGLGTTNGGQNGLLYMDATGDLYWRDKAGTSVKLN